MDSCESLAVEYCRCCDGFLVCILYEGERGSLFPGGGEDVGGWSEVDKMRVVWDFSDEKGREVAEQVKIFLVKCGRRGDFC